MLAYNKEWLLNKDIQQEAKAAFEQNCISRGELEDIKKAHPAAFYTPNVYIRIGLFLLTNVIVQFSLSLLALMFLQVIEHAWQGMILFFGLLTYVALELMIRDKKHYRSGVDDALLLTSLLLVLTGIIALLPDNSPYVIYSLLIFVATAFTVLRFASGVMTVAAVLALLGCLFYAVINLGSAGRIAAPLLLTAVSYAIYAIIKRLPWQTTLRHYRNCGLAAEITTLVTGCLCMNYFVVREASNAFFELNLQPGQNIPGAWLFWIFTVLAPLVYIAAGIWKKNAILLRTGLLLVAAMVFTIKQYHHLAPIEVEMIVAGLVMIAIAYVVIRYLRVPRHGFTSRNVHEEHRQEKVQGESLTIAETFSGSPAQDTGIQFGGGTGGGGGAQGGW